MKKRICPVCGKKIPADEHSVREHAERHAAYAWRRNPSFADYYTFLSHYFAKIWIEGRVIEE